MTFVEIEERFDRGAEIVVRDYQSSPVSGDTPDGAGSVEEHALAIIENGILVPITVGHPPLRSGQKVVVLSGGAALDTTSAGFNDSNRMAG